MSIIKKILLKYKKEKIVTQTDLYEAIFVKDIDFVRRNLKNSEILYGGYSVLNCAVCNSSFDIVELLMKDGRCDPTAKVNRSLLSAASFGNVDILKLLLKDSRVTKKDVYLELLKKAIEKKQIDIVNFILNEEEYNPFIGKNDLIGVSIEKGFDCAVKSLLLSKYFNPSFNFDVHLFDFIVGEKIELIKIVLKNKNIDLTRNENILINYADSNDMEEIVDLLFKNKKVKNTLMNNNIELYNKLNKKIISNKLGNF
jgi:hypothetical protein